MFEYSSPITVILQYKCLENSPSTKDLLSISHDQDNYSVMLTYFRSSSFYNPLSSPNVLLAQHTMLSIMDSTVLDRLTLDSSPYSSDASRPYTQALCAP